MKLLGIQVCQRQIRHGEVRRSFVGRDYHQQPFQFQRHSVLDVICAFFQCQRKVKAGIEGNRVYRQRGFVGQQDCGISPSSKSTNPRLDCASE